MPFQKGQSGNPGGKPGAARQQLEALLEECFPLAKRKKVIKLLVEDAISDEYDRRKEARPLLLAYTYGKPVERKELSGEDGAPIQFSWNATLTEITSGSDADTDTPGADAGIEHGETLG